MHYSVLFRKLRKHVFFVARPESRAKWVEKHQKLIQKHLPPLMTASRDEGGLVGLVVLVVLVGLVALVDW